MWKEIELNETPEPFRKYVEEYIKKWELVEILNVIAALDENNNFVTSHRAFLLTGNMCTVISQLHFEGFSLEISEDSMIFGEIQQFIKHPKLERWFS